LPIGNLTSQYFANFFLDPLDRFAKERLRLKGYVRYMDDFALWHNSKTEIKNIRDDVVSFAAGSLGLQLKGEPYINRVRHGMDFLGMRVFSDRVELNRRSMQRFKTKVRRYEWMLSTGLMTEIDFQDRVTALTAFVQQADTAGWRKHFFREPALNVGIKPLHPWRELEQQREQPPLWQRELEQPGQRQQQQRVSCCLPLSTMKKLEEHLWYPPVSCFLSWNKERRTA
jgi:hypothetical protein